MAFKKASGCLQAAIKAGIYGPPGSGKTFSTLLFAEGIAKRTGKRVAYCDTENGTAFYSIPVPERQAHPDAFDFDAIYTRSIAEILKECQALNPNEHSVIVIDSISHLWEAAIASYTGQKGKQGQIPMHAWGRIKAPYKALMHFLINSPFHVFILGRQGNEFTEDPDSGEIKASGVKMKAEGETPYEPHICARMESVKPLKKNSNNKLAAMEAIPTMFVEKDRTGILQGQVIEFPTFENTIAPILKLLGTKQAQVPSTEDAAAQDIEAQQKAEQERFAASHKLREQFEARLRAATSKEQADAIGKEIAEAKKTLTPIDLNGVRDTYKTVTEAIAVLANRAKSVEPNPSEAKPAETNGHASKLAAAAAVIANASGKPAVTATGEIIAEPTPQPEAKPQAAPAPEEGEWQMPEPMTQDVRDRIYEALEALGLEWDADARKRASKVIGRPVGDVERFEHFNLEDGQKLLAALEKKLEQDRAKKATAAA